MLCKTETQPHRRSQEKTPLPVIQGAKCDFEVFFNNAAEKLQRYWPEQGRESLEDWVFLPLATAPYSDKLDKTDHKREQKHFYLLMHQCLIISPIQCLLGDFFGIHFAAIPPMKDIWHSTSHKRIFSLDEGFCFGFSWSCCWDTGPQNFPQDK